MKVVTFGEVMLRLATPGHLRLNQASVLEMTFGGGEANVAVSLALLGEEAAFVTRLPKNDVAETCIQRLRVVDLSSKSILDSAEIGAMTVCSHLNAISEPTGKVLHEVVSGLGIQTDTLTGRWFSKSWSCIQGWAPHGRRYYGHYLHQVIRSHHHQRLSWIC